MFITEMELLQARLAAGKRLNDSHILKEILQEDRSSERKRRMAESRRDGWELIILSIRLRKSVSVLPVLKTAITVSSLYVQHGRMMVHGMISCR